MFGISSQKISKFWSWKDYHQDGKFWMKLVKIRWELSLGQTVQLQWELSNFIFAFPNCQKKSISENCHRKGFNGVGKCSRKKRTLESFIFISNFSIFPTTFSNSVEPPFITIFWNRLILAIFKNMLLKEKNSNFRSELGSIWVFDSRVFKDDSRSCRDL